MPSRVAIVLPSHVVAAQPRGVPTPLAVGLRNLGHEVAIVGHSETTAHRQVDSVEETLAVDTATLERPSFWEAERFDIAFVVTWLHAYRSILAAATTAGTCVIAKGDTDGRISVRTHPASTLAARLRAAEGPLNHLRAAWLWTKKAAYLEGVLMREVVANIGLAHATTVDTDAAREALLRVLRFYGAASLGEKIHVLPNPVARVFCTADVPKRKERTIYAVGRWESPEKNLGLLEGTLAALLERDSSLHAVVAGTGGEHLARRLKAQRVEYVGPVAQGALVEIASRARVCLVTSHAETFHNGAHEALVVGATVVGTPIPVVRDMVMNGAYGQASPNHRSAGLVRALRSELERWDEGLRDPGAIALHWRGELSPEVVAGRLIEIVGSASTPDG